MARRDELYEIDVAREIDNGLPEGFNATRPKVSSKYSDILITGPSSTWVEVKMNHTDNLHNIRYFYDDGMWQVKPDAKSRATDALLKEINKSPNIKDWVADIKKYMADFRRAWSGCSWVNGSAGYSSCCSTGHSGNSEAA